MDKSYKDALMYKEAGLEKPAVRVRIRHYGAFFGSGPLSDPRAGDRRFDPLPHQAC